MKKPKISKVNVGFFAGIFWSAINKFIYYESPVSDNAVACWIFSILVGVIILLASDNLAKEISDN